MEPCDRVTGRTHRRFWKCLETLPAHVLVGIGRRPPEKLARYIYRAAELSAGGPWHWRRARIHHGRPNRHSRLGRPLYRGWLLRFLAQPRLFAPRVPRKVSFILNGKLAPAVGFRTYDPPEAD